MKGPGVLKGGKTGGKRERGRTRRTDDAREKEKKEKELTV